jgi:hypothetical protein
MPTRDVQPCLFHLFGGDSGERERGSASHYSFEGTLLSSTPSGGRVQGNSRSRHRLRRVAARSSPSGFRTFYGFRFRYAALANSSKSPHRELARGAPRRRSSHAGAAPKATSVVRGVGVPQLWTTHPLPRLFDLRVSSRAEVAPKLPVRSLGNVTAAGTSRGPLLRGRPARPPDEGSRATLEEAHAGSSACRWDRG